MSNKHYRTGYAFEMRVKKWLESQGFYVMRAGQSKGTADLLAVPPRKLIELSHDVRGLTLAIQCKYKGAISPDEWNGLYELGETNSCIPILAQMPEGKKRGIELWAIIDKAEKGERERIKYKAELYLDKR